MIHAKGSKGYKEQAKRWRRWVEMDRHINRLKAKVILLYLPIYLSLIVVAFLFMFSCEARADIVPFTCGSEHIGEGTPLSALMIAANNSGGDCVIIGYYPKNIQIEYTRGKWIVERGYIYTVQTTWYGSHETHLVPVVGGVVSGNP